MSPGPRRNLTPFVVVLAAGAVVLFLLVGGLASVGRSSGPYHQSVDASFGAEARLVVDQSNVVGNQLARLIAQMPTLQRAQLGPELDDVVSGAEAVASGADAIGPVIPAGPSPGEFVRAMGSRARAAERLRTVVDGLLSISPDGGLRAPPSISPTDAVHAITAVGEQLVAADRSYRAARAAFAKTPGGSRLPGSVWVTNPVLWQAGAVTTMVDQLTSAPSLSPVVDVQIEAVALDPPVLPPAPAAAAGGAAATPGAQTVPPSCTLAVTAVVFNRGSVAVARVPVRASAQPVSGGAPFVVQKTTSLAPSASVALTLPALAVTPGETYGLTVTLDAPPGQSAPVGATSATIAVAPLAGSAKLACAHASAIAP